MFYCGTGYFMLYHTCSSFVYGMRNVSSKSGNFPVILLLTSYRPWNNLESKSFPPSPVNLQCPLNVHLRHKWKRKHSLPPLVASEIYFRLQEKRQLTAMSSVNSSFLPRLHHSPKMSGSCSTSNMLESKVSCVSVCCTGWNDICSVRVRYTVRR